MEKTAGPILILIGKGGDGGGIGIINGKIVKIPPFDPPTAKAISAHLEKAKEPVKV